MNNSTFSEDCGEFDTPVTRIVLTTIVASICFVGILGNSLVIYVVWSHHHINPLFLNLAIADLLFNLFCLPITAAHYALGNDVHLGQFVCKTYMYATYVTMGVSIYSLVAICAVRYACIAYPLYVHSALGRKTAYIASGLTWVAMLILNSPIPVIMLEDAGRRCTSRDKTNTVYYIYAFVIVGADFALPLSVIAVLSVLIIYRLRSMRDVQRRMSQYQVTCASPSMHHASKSATKRVMALVLLVVAVFLICWTPGMVLFLWNIITVLGPDSSVVSGKTSCHQRGVMYIVQDIAAIMAFSSSSLNPLVYNFGSEEFRKAFVQALTPRHMLRNRRRSSASASGIGMIRRCEFSARRTRSNRRSEV